VSPTGWAGLAEAAERTASEMNPQNIANTLNALTMLVVWSVPALVAASWRFDSSHQRRGAFGHHGRPRASSSRGANEASPWT